MDRNSLIWLAVLTLSTSNLIVGLLTQNNWLIAASSAISAALAAAIYLRLRLQKMRQPDAPPPQSKGGDAARVRTRPLPIWVFGLILFVLFPLALIALQNLAQ